MVTVEDREIAVSNPDKILFPDISMTKWEWILHMTRLAPYLLPYCRGRFLTTIRYPDGVEGDFFYQKNAPSHTPDWIQTADAGSIRYILLQDTPTLIWLANLACLEFHPSFDYAEQPGYPPEIVFDLDPSVEGFDRVMETALYTREVLQKMGLDGWVKTSGATGLQVYVPIRSGYTFEDTRRISRLIAEYLTSRYPRLITVERSVSQRGDKVYFDYLQHWRGKSLIAPYSTRARRNAPVSTPLIWEELKPGLSPEQFTPEEVHRRLARLGDPFAPLYDPNHRYDLTDILNFIKQES
ncbi:non-homologous end-joining DNA ligase [Paludifilum halophilum]|uniref:DNA polymerase domain-containing protein n=1 Tax=Paludifilum halophilum TaxID=1642702 RepID=A0A235BCI6_9BACL|nr:non-homologous end-joining DNA ligase [Paludifilum halophilum]OYD09667.1 DNA polymerase domain-containing protein [Paludifilum halophilum]